MKHGPSRCRRRRRRVLRPLHDAPTAPAGALGAGLRGGHGCRRHLVLESLSGCALRQRELELLLLLPAGTRSGLALAAALLGTARNIEVHRARRHHAGSTQALPLQHPGKERIFRCGTQSVDHRHRARRSGHRAFPDHGDRLPFEAQLARHRWHRRLSGRSIPHRSVAPLGRRFLRQAGRGDRHRLDRHPVDSGDRQAGRPALRLPAYRQPLRAGAQWTDGPTSRADL